MKPWQCIFLLSGCLQGGEERLEGEWYALLNNRVDGVPLNTCTETITFGYYSEYSVSQDCATRHGKWNGSYAVNGETITVCWDDEDVCFDMRWALGSVPGTLLLESNPDTVLVERKDSPLLLKRSRP